MADADNPEVTRAQQAAREAAARDILRRTEETIVTVCRLENECGAKARASTTDVDARVTKMPDGGFRPGNNIQLAVAGKATGGPRTIVGVDVTNLGRDMGGVTKMIDEVNEMTGAVPKHILADGNHVRHACLDVAAARGVDVIAPPSKRSNARTNDSAAVTAWRKRMTTDDAKRLYRGRAALVELANAHLKSSFALDRVLVRGLGNVLCVGIIAALTFNIVRHAAAFT